MLLRYCVSLLPYLRYNACPATPAPLGQLLPLPLQPPHLHRPQHQSTATPSSMGSIGDVEARAAASEGPGGRGGPSSGVAEQHTGAPAPTVQTGDMVAREVTGSTLDLSVGQPSPSSLPLAALAAAAAHRLASPDVSNSLLLQYGPRQGYRSFREALAAFLAARYGTAVAADSLLVTAGVSHGLGLCALALSRPGDVVVAECPTYFLVPPIFRDHHLVLQHVPTDQHGMDVEALEAWMRADPAHRPRLVYVIPIHNNPRGTTLPPARRRRLLQLAHQYDFFVLADEVYQLLSFPGASSPSSIASAAATATEPLPLPLRAYEECPLEHSRVLSLGSFSKILAPALRLGWIQAAPSLLDRLKADGVISSGGCIAQLSCGLAHSALELGLQQQHLDAVVRPGLEARCVALCEALREHLPPGCSFRQPLGGYFVWVELPHEVDSSALLREAEGQHGVRFTPGAACGGGGQHCVRLSYSFYTEDELREAARRLGRAVREHLLMRTGSPAGPGEAG